jgi:hypothetical protein
LGAHGREAGQRQISRLGVQPCINCSEILPPGSSATTIELGADAASACVCSPGACGCRQRSDCEVDLASSSAIIACMKSQAASLAVSAHNN